jgi:hypothetical protein
MEKTGCDIGIRTLAVRQPSHSKARFDSEQATEKESGRLQDLTLPESALARRSGGPSFDPSFRYPSRQASARSPKGIIFQGFG